MLSTLPQAEEGHQVIEGCLLRTCEANGWRTSLVSNICCYERKPYTMNTTISSIMSEDGCAKASLDCVKESPGNAKMVLNVENYCKDYASNEQLEEFFLSNKIFELFITSKCLFEQNSSSCSTASKFSKMVYIS